MDEFTITYDKDKHDGMIEIITGSPIAFTERVFNVESKGFQYQVLEIVDTGHFGYEGRLVGSFICKFGPGSVIENAFRILRREIFKPVI